MDEKMLEEIKEFLRESRNGYGVPTREVYCQHVGALLEHVESLKRELLELGEIVSRIP